jgi:hypothetical protein
VALRSELQAKERALAQAKGQISKLEEELGKAKARELAEARQALAYERKLGKQVIKAECSKGAGAGKRRRGASDPHRPHAASSSSTLSGEPSATIPPFVHFGMVFSFPFLL